MESIIFNLANNIDIVETNKKIDDYKKANKEQIQKARLRKPDTILELESILEHEKQCLELRRVQSVTTAKEEKIRKQKNREALIDDLMFLEDVDAKKIVEQHKIQQQQQENQAPAPLDLPAPPAPAPTQFTSGIGFGSKKTFLPVPKTEEVPLYQYKPFQIRFDGPEPPTLEQLRQSTNSSQGATYLQHIRAADKSELAGGYHHSLACRRALQDAFMDVAIQPKILFANKATAAVSGSDVQPMEVV